MIGYALVGSNNLEAAKAFFDEMVKPLADAAVEDGDIVERITEPVWPAGNFNSPSVLGRSRSGGTSSGRVSGLWLKTSSPLRNQLQPEAPIAATATAATTIGRMCGWRVE